MKLHIRNKVASVDLKLTDDRSAVSLHLVTVSDHEATIVIPRHILEGLIDRYRELKSENSQRVNGHQQQEHHRRVAAALSEGVLLATLSNLPDSGR
jgi:hypothetical protein